jgi:hypothetical protein
MPYVGYTGVANQANTSNGFADGVGAANVPVTDGYGENVGDTGVVDLYQITTPPTPTLYYILMENSGYVLQQDTFKIELEVQ